MASSLSPTSIDATFPVAGQDNDSQGFRDNFNQIKTDLTNAKSELEDLQSNAVLKCIRHSKWNKFNRRKQR